MAKEILIYDHISIDREASKPYLHFEDAMVTMENGDKIPGIYVTVQATHAARITGNHGLYLPAMMRDGARTMLEPYEKPIGVNHQDLADPIGRIKHAEYVATGIPTILNSLNLNALYSNISFEKQAEIIVKLAKTGILYDRAFEGLGYILSTGLITDPDAMDKIRDGRYQTVSIEAGSTNAICSACMTDWVDGRCEHSPGEDVDGEKMFLIAGELIYKGWDWVNKPADEIAKVVSISDSDGGIEIIDSVNCYSGTNTMLVLSDSINSGVEVFTTGTKTIDNINIDNRKKEQEPMAVKNTFVSFNSLVDKIITIMDGTNADLVMDDSDTDLLYSAMSEFLSKDSVLTAENRKSLQDSAFCGSTRGFPVPDCEHVAALTKLLDKYTGEMNTDKLVESLNHKAQALGYTAEDKVEDPVAVDDPNTADNMFVADKMDDTELQQVFADVETELIQRKLKVDTYSAALTRLEFEKATIEDTLNTEKEAGKELQNQLKYLRDELRHSYTESSESNKARTDTLSQLRAVIFDSLNLFSKLSGSSDVDESVLNQLPIDGLFEHYANIKDSVKIDDVLSKLHDGTTTITDSTVIEDPTTDDSTPAAVTTTIDDNTFTDAENNILAYAKKIYTAKGINGVRNHLQYLSRCGIIESDSKFLNLFEITD